MPRFYSGIPLLWIIADENTFVCLLAQFKAIAGQTISVTFRLTVSIVAFIWQHLCRLRCLQYFLFIHILFFFIIRNFHGFPYPFYILQIKYIIYVTQYYSSKCQPILYSISSTAYPIHLL